jgi:hypothetical protein
MLKRFLDQAASSLASSTLGTRLLGRLIPFNFEKWGQMTSLKLDSDKGQIEAVLDLKGEDKPVELMLRYHLIEQEGQTQMVIEQISTSRQWLTALLSEVALKQKNTFEVPAQAAVLLGKVVK